jgi:hypothetical protein
MRRMDALTRYLILVLSLLFLSLALFFLSGLVIVGKDKAVIVSKQGHFEKILTSGVYYFLPFSCHLSRVYPLQDKAFRIHLGKGAVLEGKLHYEELEVFYLFHTSLKRKAQEIYRKSPQEPALESLLEKELSKMGVVLKDVTLLRK